MINKVILVGNLGDAPEVRHTGSGDAVATFSLATTEKWTDKNGQKNEDTVWHKIVVWRRLAETCGKYLSKGSKIYLEGKIQNRKWEDKDGNNRYTTEIQARDIQFLSTRGEGNNGGSVTHREEPPDSVGEDVPF